MHEAFRGRFPVEACVLYCKPLSPASNLVAAVSLIIMVDYSQYTACMEGRHPLVHIIIIN